MKFAALGMIVVASVCYQICSKQTPALVSPYISLMVTYTIALITSALLYLLTRQSNVNFITELRNLNWAPFILGVTVCLLEFGYLLAYRAGFRASELVSCVNPISMGLMLVVGLLLYKEPLSWKQLAGVCFSGVGIVIATR